MIYYVLIIPSYLILMFLLGALGISMQVVSWIAAHIHIISAVLWAIILMAVCSHSRRGERLLRVSEAVPFFPFYLGLVFVLLKWANMLNMDGLSGILNFAVYIIEIPFQILLYLLPSYLIFTIGRSFQRNTARILFNLILSAAYFGFVYYKNYSLIVRLFR